MVRKYEAGARLRSENELAERYLVSRGTVRLGRWLSATATLLTRRAADFVAPVELVDRASLQAPVSSFTKCSLGSVRQLGNVP